MLEIERLNLEVDGRPVLKKSRPHTREGRVPRPARVQRIRKLLSMNARKTECGTINGTNLQKLKTLFETIAKIKKETRRK